MAQLDFVTYLYQFTWLAVIYFCFYIVFLRWIFPAISAALKGRIKKRIITRKENYSRLNFLFNHSKRCSLYWDYILKVQDKHIKYFQIKQVMLRLKLSSSIN